MPHSYSGPPASKTRPQYYRSVFLSDFHIGARSFDAKALTRFLQSFECETLYLVGDIIDGWKLNKAWYWDDDYSTLFDILAAKIDQGMRLVYLPGNHDEEVRNISQHRRRRFAKRFKIEICDKIIHTMIDGRRFLVMHGDQFDRKILQGPLSRWSDRFYDTIMELCGAHEAPKVYIKGEVKRFSLAKSLSRHGQWALHLLNNFENAVYKMAKSKSVDGLICGHTHIPVIKPIKDILYANCGKWLRDGHTALIENRYGDLELINWPASFEDTPEQTPCLFHTLPGTYVLRPDFSKYRTATLAVMQTIRRLWPEEAAQAQPLLKPLEWIEIKNRDDVIIKRYAGLASHALCKPQTAPAPALCPKTIARTRHLTCGAPADWREDLQKPMYFYEAFIAPATYTPRESALEPTLKDA